MAFSRKLTSTIGRFLQFVYYRPMDIQQIIAIIAGGLGFVIGIELLAGTRGPSEGPE